MRYRYGTDSVTTTIDAADLLFGCGSTALCRASVVQF
jgi:hypothetical protein